VAASGLFLFDDSTHQVCVAGLLRRLPELQGDPIRIQNSNGLGKRRGPVHAGAFLRERRIAFDCKQAEFARIFVHELAHFIWLRLGNPRRWHYEDLLRRELAARVRGELGWSAEWRKLALTPRVLRDRSRAWREYCCESFCDTAAWRWSGLAGHPEFTLAKMHRVRRAQWLESTLGTGPLSI
jgi:hypothetical protein